MCTNSSLQTSSENKLFSKFQKVPKEVLEDKSFVSKVTGYMPTVYQKKRTFCAKSSFRYLYHTVHFCTLECNSNSPFHLLHVVWVSLVGYCHRMLWSLLQVYVIISVISIYQQHQLCFFIALRLAFIYGKRLNHKSWETRIALRTFCGS